MNKRVLTWAAFLGVAMATTAQVGTGGTPWGIRLGLDASELPTVRPAPFDAVAVAAEDSLRDLRHLLPTYGRILELGGVDLSAGRWDEAPNGDRIWRLRVESPGALATELYYADLHLPKDAALYVYSEDHEQVLGGYTSYNHTPDGIFSTALIDGSACIVEYNEPAEVMGEGAFRLTGVNHAYRMMGGGSGSCEVDVNCSEGDGWANERNATVRISVVIGSATGWCTGTLVNNVAQDCKPYFLTAKHCAISETGVDATVANLNQWRFYFRYQRSGCATGSSNQGFSILGCTERGDSEDLGGENGSDFFLVEANQSNIPSLFNPYWAGWNAGTAASTGGKGIHHPAGDVKKISTFTGTTQTSGWGTNGTHWRVTWVATANGHGVTEGGSSGSALFNSDHKIIGTLTGGSSCCTVNGCGFGTGPSSPDLYGKLSHHWTGNPNQVQDKLKYWLDPNNTGTLILEGSANPCAPSAVEELMGEAPSVYPNPASDQLTVEMPEGTLRADRIELLDAAGRVVRSYSPRTSGRVVLDVAGLDNGLHLLRMTADGRQHSAVRVNILH